ncbi:hypothetical protein EMCRGX_G019437, partial [Ephydatia muelleri]
QPQQMPQQGYNPPIPQIIPQQASTGIPQVQYRNEPSATIVVQSQPAATVSTATRPVAQDRFFILSIVMTILCCICGGWWALILTIPAIFLANAARGDDAKGNHALAAKKGQMALWLNIIAIMFYGLILVIIVAGNAASS